MPRRPPRSRRRLRRVIAPMLAVTALAVALVACGRSGPPAFDAGWRRLAQARFSGRVTGDGRWDLYQQSRPAKGAAPATVGTRNGQLELTTRGRQGTGLCWCEGRRPRLYGRWEVRERMTRGQGYGEATLLWPADNDWPDHGEIDFSEINDAQRASSAVTVHYSSKNRKVVTYQQADFTRWHTFAVEWEARDVRVWLDGRLVFSCTDPAQIPHHPMFLALQDGPNGQPRAAPSSTLQVAWVRAYAP